MAKGEGSRGGKVIGHTKSGRAIYATGAIATGVGLTARAEGAVMIQRGIKKMHAANNYESMATAMVQGSGASKAAKTMSIITHIGPTAEKHRMAGRALIRQGSKLKKASKIGMAVGITAMIGGAIIGRKKDK